MIDIYNMSLLDLLPPNLKQDPDMIAASKAIDSEFTLIANEAKSCILLPRIDELDSDVVDLLAWQLHVDFYNNDLPLETRRQLVKNSIRWHRIKGTAAAVKEIATTVFGKTDLQEWFEYNGKPFFFKLNIDISETGASSDNLKLLDRLIDEYKNERSWLDIINIFLTGFAHAYFGAFIASGENITVYPWQNTNIQSNGKISAALYNNSIEDISLYPKKEE